MVKSKQFLLSGIYALACLSAKANFATAADNGLITKFVEAEACDDRELTDDTKTAENRAVDKASISAVKLSGIVQARHPELTASALDIIAYRIIDEYMLNATHKVTISDDSHVCVKLKATVEMTPDELDKLITEYKNSEPTEFQASEIADKINENTTFKANTLQDKKLLFIDNMMMWNGEETDHYHDFLYGLFSSSDYFYVTDAPDAKDYADYIVSPSLSRSVVDKIDKEHHKMQMVVEIAVTSSRDADFDGLGIQQNHFILFPADKNEQEIADTLIRKLLTRAANEAVGKLNSYLSKQIEDNLRKN